MVSPPQQRYRKEVNYIQPSEFDLAFDNFTLLPSEPIMIRGGAAHTFNEADVDSLRASEKQICDAEEADP